MVLLLGVLGYYYIQKIVIHLLGYPLALPFALKLSVDPTKTLCCDFLDDFEDRSQKHKLCCMWDSMDHLESCWRSHACVHDGPLQPG